MMDCKHRNGLHGRTQSNGLSVVIHNCDIHRICTIDPSGLRKHGGAAVPSCVQCADRDRGEPVGSVLSGILEACGVSREVCAACRDWVSKMNRWGLAGCRDHRAEILARLDEAAAGASWLDWGKVAACGYVSTAALLDEAIQRVSRGDF